MNIHYCAFHGSHENSNCLRGGVGVAVPLVRNASAKKKPRNEIIANSSHRMAIFSLSVVISFSFVPPLPRRGDAYREN